MPSYVPFVPLVVSACYALAGALRATCANVGYCQVNYDLVGKVLGVWSIDIAQYSKALR